MDILNGFYNTNKKSIADPYCNGIQRFDKLAQYVNMAIKGLGDNTVSAIEVAKALYMIKRDKLYQDYPMPGIEDQRFHDFDTFAQTMFGAKKSTIYNYLALYEKFGSDSVLRVQGIPPKFETNYSYTQLLLMLPLDAPELLKIKPTMTCSEIKKRVKEVKANTGGISNRLENIEELEDFALNNDERRLAFLETYKRWTKCAECDVVNTHVTFYDVVLDNKHLVAVNTTSSDNVFDSVAYFLFSISSLPSGVYTFDRCFYLDMRWATSSSDIIKHIRDRKIKSIKIKSEHIRDNK